MNDKYRVRSETVGRRIVAGMYYGWRLTCAAISVALSLAALSGCNQSEYRTVPVSGRVTLDGQPLTNVRVGFQPINTKDPLPGPGSVGVTDADGRFRLQVIGTRENGAVIGQHIVRISRFQTEEEANDDRPAKRDTSIPIEAENGSLRFQVPSDGADNADFALTLKTTPKPRR